MIYKISLGYSVIKILFVPKCMIYIRRFSNNTGKGVYFLLLIYRKEKYIFTIYSVRILTLFMLNWFHDYILQCLVGHFLFDIWNFKAKYLQLQFNSVL